MFAGLPLAAKYQRLRYANCASIYRVDMVTPWQIATCWCDEWFGTIAGLPWSGAGHVMLKLLNLFLVIFGVIAIGAGLATWNHYLAMALLLFALGGALVALAYVSDRRRERHVQEKKRLAIQQRIDEFARGSASSSLTLKVGGGFVYLLASLVMTALSAVLLYVEAIAPTHDVILLLAGVFLFPLGLLLLFRTWASVGQPRLELNGTGFITPLNGRIAWRDVSGIALRTISGRYGHETFALMFRVKQFARVAARIHWTDRLLAVFRIGPLVKGVVSVGLPFAKDPPQAVYAFARQLWKQSTGNDYEWNPLLSDDYNEAMKRVGAFTNRVQESVVDVTAPSEPRWISEGMTRMTSDTSLMAAEQKRQLKKLRWTMVIFPVLIVLFVAWPWIMRLLRH